jgi:hypothetical protein
MESTPYIEECCAVIESAKQYSSDLYLVQLVQLQIIVGKIRRNILPRHGIGAPVVLYINALQAEVQQLKCRVPSDSEGSRT